MQTGLSTPDDSRPATVASLVRRWWGAAALVIADGLFMQQGLVASIAGIVVIVRLLRALVALAYPRTASGGPVDFARRRPERARSRLKQTVPLALGVVLTFAIIVGNNKLARHRARAIVVAVERYRAEQGAYPPSLEALVPRYLPSVPRAKWSFAFARFEYRPIGGEDDAVLQWTSIPPFARPFHRFKDRRWGTLD